MRRQRSGGGFSTFIVIFVAVAAFSYVVWSNGQTAAAVRPFVPLMPSPTDVGNTWQESLRANLDGSPVPTVQFPDQNFVAPTLIPQTSVTPVEAGNVPGSNGEVFAAGATPTLPPPTATNASGGSVAVIVPTIVVRATSLPSMNVPLSLDARGWDHYWFSRPVSADAVNFGSSYSYGTNGPRDSALAIHTGIDIANPEGTVIRAGGAGKIVFATDPTDPEQTTFENSPAYGNVVVIEYAYGFQGQPVYMVYAHLLSVLVKKEDPVTQGQAVALTGNTGHSTGPHVHFEVRVFQNRFGSTYNPALWLAPYVGHGTIAGRVVGERGQFLDDVDVQLVRGGYVQMTTTSYVFRGSGSEVNPDPNWNENFVLFDVPQGRYRVEALINGVKISRVVDVREGMTTEVELAPNESDVNAATPTP